MANQTSLKNIRQFKNDNPILSDLKPHMGNSWVRHKQLLESESADGFPILSEFWNLKCEILELGTRSLIPESENFHSNIRKKFPILIWRSSLKVFHNAYLDSSSKDMPIVW